MADPLDSIRFSFNGIDLLKYCPELRDTFGPRFAAHTLWGRDGARQEEGALMPRKVRAKLNFAGDEWQREISDVLGRMVARPRGSLVHPLQGTFQAVLKAPLEASIDLARRGAHYEVDATWEEDAYDQRLTFEKGPAGQAQIVTEQTAVATTAAAALQTATYARYTIGPIAQRFRGLADRGVSLTASFTGAADAYAAAALGQFNTGTWDPALDVSLKRLPSLATPAILALRLVSGHKAYDATTAIHRALKAATDLDLALRALFPVPILFPVRQKMSLYELVQALYPHKSRAQRLALADQVQRINRLARPDVLTPDLVLRVPTP